MYKLQFTPLFLLSVSSIASAQEWVADLNQPEDLAQITAVLHTDAGIVVATSSGIDDADGRPMASAVLWLWDGDEAWTQLAEPWDGGGRISALAEYDGKLWATGQFWKTDTGETLDSFLAVSQDDGATWDTWWPDGFSDAGSGNALLAIAEDDLSGLYIAGEFLADPDGTGTERNAFMRLDGDIMTGLGLADDFDARPNLDTPIAGHALAVGPVSDTSDVVLLGGHHSGVGGKPHLATYDGTSLGSLPGAINIGSEADGYLEATVSALAFHHEDATDNVLYVGGYFEGAVQEDGTVVESPALTRWHPTDGWTQPGLEITNAEIGLSETDNVHGLLTDGLETLYVLGSWTSPNTLCAGIGTFDNKRGWFDVRGIYTDAPQVISRNGPISEPADTMIIAGLLTEVGPPIASEVAHQIAEYNGHPCRADLNFDGAVNGDDLSLLLAAWGSADADLTGDGATTANDLGMLLARWDGCGYLQD